MAKRGRKPKQPKVGDPIGDLPNAPAMRLYLVLEQAEQHRRGNQRARRINPMSIDGLHKAHLISDREHAAAEAFMVLSRWAMGSPAPRSCCDATVRGAPPPEDEKAIARQRQWDDVWRAVFAHGPLISTEITHVLWEGLDCQNVDALRVGLRAVGRVMGQIR